MSDVGWKINDCSCLKMSDPVAEHQFEIGHKKPFNIIILVVKNRQKFLDIVNIKLKPVLRVQIVEMFVYYHEIATYFLFTHFNAR